ncbi:MAG: cytochrome c, partial [Planctomycetes bacterium]|nr:cytochrome c [Planctomycetota bacterium]
MTDTVRNRFVICSIALAVFISGTVGIFADEKKVDAGKIFNNNCAKCHGKLGTPTKRGQKLGAAAFSDRLWQESITDEQIIKAITYGIKDMPAWRKELTPEEIKA